MNKYNLIVSSDNSLIKKVVRLATDSKFRNQQKLAVIYGEHLLIEAKRYNLLEHVLVLDSKLDKYTQILAEYPLEQISLLPINLMRKVNVLDYVADLVSIIKIQEPVIQLYKNTHDNCLLLDQIQDPGNLGTILRACSASGARNIYISKNSVDIYNPKVTRASQGLQFGLNIYVNMDSVAIISQYPGQVIAMTPHATNSLYNLDLTKSTMLVFGNEGSGLSSELLQKIKQHACIPMQNNSESLNLAMAVTVSLFEVARQNLYLIKS